MQFKSLLLAIAVLLLPSVAHAHELWAVVNKLVTCQTTTVTWGSAPSKGKLDLEIGHVTGSGPGYPIIETKEIGSGSKGHYSFYVHPNSWVLGDDYFFGVSSVANPNKHATAPNVQVENGCDDVAELWVN